MSSAGSRISGGASSNRMARKSKPKNTRQQQRSPSPRSPSLSPRRELTMLMNGTWYNGAPQGQYGFERRVRQLLEIITRPTGGRGSAANNSGNSYATRVSMSRSRSVGRGSSR
jgi:hypothetical protein